MKFIFVFVASIASFASWAQTKQDTVFCDNGWNTCTREKAAYFRFIEVREGKMHVVDHYMSGQVQMTGEYISLIPKRKDGHFIFYSRSGKITSEETYADNRKHGRFIYYNEAGIRIKECTYKNDTLNGEYKLYNKHSQGDSTWLWYAREYKNGKPGHNLSVYYENGQLKRKEVYEGETPISRDCYNEEGNPIPYFPFEEPAEFVGGEEALAEYLQKTIEYPKKARKLNIEGKVYIKFFIDAQGYLKNAYIVRGIGGGCDQEALRAVQMMPRWTPGMMDGKPAQIEFNLPIEFKLH